MWRDWKSSSRLLAWKSHCVRKYIAQIRLILPQRRTRMFSEGESPRTLAEFDLTDRLPFCFRPRTKSPKILGRKLSTMELEKSRCGIKKKNKKKKKSERPRYMPFRKHATRSPPPPLLSFVSLLVSSLTRTVAVTHPLSTYFLQSQLPLHPRSFVSILYSESTFSQYRNRSRIGAWRRAIRRAGREIVLS